MKISVIIPVYNVEKYLRRCLNSVVNQTYKNIEIFLIDDGSTDNSGDICDEFAKKDSRIIVIHKKNEGQSIARNIALDKASGDYISFVDADDFIDLKCYEKMIEQVKKTKTKLVVCNFQVFKNKDDIKYNKTEMNSEIINTEQACRELLTSTGRVKSYLCNKLYDNSLLKDIRFPKYNIFEDLSIMYKLVEKCEEIIVINEILYYYFDRKDSSSKKISSENFINKLKVVKEREEYLNEKYKGLKEDLDRYHFNNSLYTFLAIARNKDKDIYNSEVLNEEYKYIMSYIKEHGMVCSMKTLRIYEKTFLILFKINKNMAYYLISTLVAYKK